MTETLRWKGDKESIDFALYKAGRIGKVGDCPECGSRVVGEQHSVEYYTIGQFGICFRCMESIEFESQMEKDMSDGVIRL